MQVEILRIQRALGITTVFVTHDQAEAMSLSDWIVVMNHGRVEQAGTARDLYDHPTSRFVADFFGKVNFLPVQVRGSDATGTAVDLLGHTLRIGTQAKVPPDRAVLALRPEYLCLAAPDIVFADRNALPGRVTSAQFLGNVLRCDIALTDALSLLVETAPADPLGLPGTDVQVTWSHNQGALFADPSPERTMP